MGNIGRWADGIPERALGCEPCSLLRRWRPCPCANAWATRPPASGAIPAPSDPSGETRAIILVAIADLLWDVVYTVSDVPYGSLTAVMTTDEGQRTRLVAWARTAANLALAAMTLGGPLMAKALGWTATASWPV